MDNQTLSRTREQALDVAETALATVGRQVETAVRAYVDDPTQRNLLQVRAALIDHQRGVELCQLLGSTKVARPSWRFSPLMDASLPAAPYEPGYRSVLDICPATNQPHRFLVEGVCDGCSQAAPR